MIFITIPIILICFYALSSISEKLNEAFYRISLVFLTLFACFRYGQGTDYFHYKYIFLKTNTLSDVIYNTAQVHSEIGARFIYFLFGTNYELFIMVVSIFEMYCLYRFLERYSQDKLLSLILFYPTYYLVYFFSAVRQGIVISILIGFLLEAYEDEDYKKYVLLTLLAASVHVSALIFLCFPFLKIIKIKDIEKILFVSLTVGLCFFLGAQLLYGKLPSSLSFYAVDSIGLFSLLSRLIYLFLILVLVMNIDKDSLTEVDVFFLRILVFSLVIYLLLLPFTIIASRFNYLLRVVEVVVFPSLIMKNNCRFTALPKLMIVVVIGLSVAFTYKNISGFLNEADYEYINSPLEYPYITVFNKDDLFYYRSENDFTKWTEAQDV